MIDLAALKRLEGRRLELRFADGYVARVKLLDVDLGSRQRELVYDLEQVLSWGPVDPKRLDMKAAHAANAGDLEGWTALD